MDKNRVDAFEIREDDQLFQRRMIAQVSIRIRVCVTPFAGRQPEEGDVEQAASVA